MISIAWTKHEVQVKSFVYSEPTFVVTMNGSELTIIIMQIRKTLLSKCYNFIETLNACCFAERQARDMTRTALVGIMMIKRT
jgi:hypothetical protein